MEKCWTQAKPMEFDQHYCGRLLLFCFLLFDMCTLRVECWCQLSKVFLCAKDKEELHLDLTIEYDAYNWLVEYLDSIFRKAYKSNLYLLNFQYIQSILDSKEFERDYGNWQEKVPLNQCQGMCTVNLLSGCSAKFAPV